MGPVEGDRRETIEGILQFRQFDEKSDGFLHRDALFDHQTLATSRLEENSETKNRTPLNGTFFEPENIDL